jgi:hypothetical protein
VSVPNLILPVEEEDQHAALAEHLAPHFRREMERAGPGHRLRVTTLPLAVMERLAMSLQDSRWEVRVLSDGPKGPHEATAATIIRLRDHEPAPLLALFPPGPRTAAEDSLDIATFTELSLAAAARELADALIERLEEPLRRDVREALRHLAEVRLIRNVDEEVEFVLTVLKNGGGAAAAGGAIFLFGLVPDFDLFVRGGENLRFWLSRNQQKCEKLADLNQPIQKRLQALGLRPESLQKELFAFFRERHTEDPRVWGKAIACDASARHLAFDRWQFADTENEAGLRIVLDPLDLARQEADEVGGTDQMRVFNVNGRDPLKVAFRTVPAPAQAAGWKSWRVQLFVLGEDGVSLAWESNAFPKPTSSRSAKLRRSVKPKDLEFLDEGTYFLRLEAYDAEGAVLTASRRADPANVAPRAENESEPFLLAKADTVTVEADVRTTLCPSLLTAWARAAARALMATPQEAPPARPQIRGSWSQPVGASVKGDVRFEIETDRLAGCAIVVPGLLWKVQATLLQHPRALGIYSMALADARTPGDVELVRRESAPPFDDVPSFQAFLDARERVFRAIVGHHEAVSGEDRGQPGAGSVEVVDLTQHTAAIVGYAKAFAELVENAMRDNGDPHRELLRFIGWLDAVELRWRSQPGDPGRGVLVAPTHPLRLLWHLRHTSLCASMLDAWQSKTQDAPDWRRLIERVSEDLLPLNLPMVCFDRRGRALVETLPVTPFWSIYLPDRDDAGRPVDASTARARALNAMGIKAQSPAVTSVRPDEIADLIFDYTVQHPYIDQLRLNVFNPGSGELVADVLRRLEALRREQARPLPGLRYAVHLFSPTSQLDSAGDAVESLLDPERHVGEDDEFTIQTENHLHPKLLIARGDITDFAPNHARYPAHISIVMEPFSAHGRVGTTTLYRSGAFVGGLVQEPETLSLDGPGQTSGGIIGWSKGVRPSARVGVDAHEALIAEVLAATQRLQASIAIGQAVDGQTGPILALQLDADAQALLRHAHDASDQVITVDRHLGLDFFDMPAGGKGVGYLLDFAPEFIQEDRQRAILTTGNTREVADLLRPTLVGYGIQLRPGDEVMVLDSLRSLSGRLAMRLSAASSRSKEAVGLLFARWLLEDVGALADRIVIPLDAHRSWFQGEGPQRRADLALVGFPTRGVIRFDIIEVKLRDDLPPASRATLYQSMREQIDTTEERLRALFDPERYPRPRADLPLRSKELAGVLAFYVRRAVRYGLLPVDSGELVLGSLAALETGYRLDVQRLGIAFERLGAGHHVDEDEPGFVVHRFGADKARKLFDAAMGRHDERSSRASNASTVPPSARGHARLAESPQEERYVEALRATLSVRHKVGAPADEQIGDTAPTASDPVRCESAEPQAPGTGARGPSPGNGADRQEGGGGACEAAAPTLVTQGQGSCEPKSPITPVPDVLLGASSLTPQFGILGRAAGQTVALDLNGCNTISLFGVQGFGKSYTLGVIAEMASMASDGINVLPSPLATVIFHFHKSDAYEPEYVSAVLPNRKVSEVDRLLAEYGASPRGLEDVVLLAPEAKVEQRRREYPGVLVAPIKFSSSELGAEGWKFLLGAFGNDSLYVRQLVAIMRRQRDRLSLAAFRDGIAQADLPKSAMRLAEDRLALAEPYIDDDRPLTGLLRPGRTVIVDLRDEWIEKDEALGLFVVMMRIFAASRHDGREFNKLVVFDEAHKYISESDLIDQVVGTIREMRHQATSVVIASQDPMSLPRAIVELTSVLIMHRMTSPQWLKHLRGAIVALDDLQESAVTSLQPGEALVWAQRSTDRRFTVRPQKMSVRPRVTQHGGGTKTAVSGATLR